MECKDHRAFDMLKVEFPFKMSLLDGCCYQEIYQTKKLVKLETTTDDITSYIILYSIYLITIKYTHHLNF